MSIPAFDSKSCVLCHPVRSSSSLPVEREAKKPRRASSHLIPHWVLCPDHPTYMFCTDWLVLVVYGRSPCLEGLGEHLGNICQHMQTVCSFPSPLFWLIGRGLAPTTLLNICVAGWKFAFSTKWHTDFLDSLSLMCGRCFPAWGLLGFTAYLQSSWSFSVILAGKLHSFPYPRNSGLWPMVSPIKKLS